MDKQAIRSSDAPAAIGPYSQAIRAGSLLYLSGQIGIDPSTGQMVPGSVGDQMRRVLANAGAVLEAAGSGLDQVVKTTIYLRAMSDFAVVNEVYGEVFSEPFPARATVAVAGLPLDALVEMELVALGP